MESNASHEEVLEGLCQNTTRESGTHERPPCEAASSSLPVRDKLNDRLPDNNELIPGNRNSLIEEQHDIVSSHESPPTPKPLDYRSESKKSAAENSLSFGCGSATSQASDRFLPKRYAHRSNSLSQSSSNMLDLPDDARRVLSSEHFQSQLESGPKDLRKTLIQSSRPSSFSQTQSSWPFSHQSHMANFQGPSSSSIPTQVDHNPFLFNSSSYQSQQFYRSSENSQNPWWHGLKGHSNSFSRDPHNWAGMEDSSDEQRWPFYTYFGPNKRSQVPQNLVHQYYGQHQNVYYENKNYYNRGHASSHRFYHPHYRPRPGNRNSLDHKNDDSHTTVRDRQTVPRRKFGVVTRTRQRGFQSNFRNLNMLSKRLRNVRLQGPRRPQSAGAILMHSAIPKQFKLSRKILEKKDPPEDPNRKALTAAADKLLRNFLATKRGSTTSEEETEVNLDVTVKFPPSQENAEDLSMKNPKGHTKSTFVEFRDNTTFSPQNSQFLMPNLADQDFNGPMFRRRRHLSESSSHGISHTQSLPCRPRTRSTSVAESSECRLLKNVLDKPSSSRTCVQPQINKILVKQLLTMDKKSLHELVGDPRSRKVKFLLNQMMRDHDQQSRRLDLLHSQKMLHNPGLPPPTTSFTAIDGELEMLGHLEALDIDKLSTDVLQQVNAILNAEESDSSVLDLTHVSLSIDELMSGEIQPCTSSNNTNDVEEVPMPLIKSPLSSADAISLANGNGNNELIQCDSNMNDNVDVGHRQMSDNVPDDSTHLTAPIIDKHSQLIRMEPNDISASLMQVNSKSLASKTSTEFKPISSPHIALTSEGIDEHRRPGSKGIRVKQMDSLQNRSNKLSDENFSPEIMSDTINCLRDLSNKSCSSDVECQIVSPPPKRPPTTITIEDSDTEDVRNYCRGQTSISTFCRGSELIQPIKVDTEDCVAPSTMMFVPIVGNESAKSLLPPHVQPIPRPVCSSSSKHEVSCGGLAITSTSVSLPLPLPRSLSCHSEDLKLQSQANVTTPAATFLSNVRTGVPLIQHAVATSTNGTDNSLCSQSIKEDKSCFVAKSSPTNILAASSVVVVSRCNEFVPPLSQSQQQHKTASSEQTPMELNLFTSSPAISSVVKPSPPIPERPKTPEPRPQSRDDCSDTNLFLHPSAARHSLHMMRPLIHHSAVPAMDVLHHHHDETARATRIATFIETSRLDLESLGGLHRLPVSSTAAGTLRVQGNVPRQACIAATLPLAPGRTDAVLPPQNDAVKMECLAPQQPLDCDLCRHLHHTYAVHHHHLAQCCPFNQHTVHPPPSVPPRPIPPMPPSRSPPPHTPPASPTPGSGLLHGLYRNKHEPTYLKCENVNRPTSEERPRNPAPPLGTPHSMGLPAEAPRTIIFSPNPPLHERPTAAAPPYEQQLPCIKLERQTPVSQYQCCCLRNECARSVSRVSVDPHRSGSRMNTAVTPPPRPPAPPNAAAVATPSREAEQHLSVQLGGPHASTVVSHANSQNSDIDRIWYFLGPSSGRTCGLNASSHAVVRDSSGRLAMKKERLTPFTAASEVMSDNHIWSTTFPSSGFMLPDRISPRPLEVAADVGARKLPTSMVSVGIQTLEFAEAEVVCEDIGAEQDVSTDLLPPSSLSGDNRNHVPFRTYRSQNALNKVTANTVVSSASSGNKKTRPPVRVQDTNRVAAAGARNVVTESSVSNPVAHRTEHHAIDHGCMFTPSSSVPGNFSLLSLFDRDDNAMNELSRFNNIEGILVKDLQGIDKAMEELTVRRHSLRKQLLELHESQRAVMQRLMGELQRHPEYSVYGRRSVPVLPSCINSSSHINRNTSGDEDEKLAELADGQADNLEDSSVSQVSSTQEPCSHAQTSTVHSSSLGYTQQRCTSTSHFADNCKKRSSSRGSSPPLSHYVGGSQSDSDLDDVCERAKCDSDDKDSLAIENVGRSNFFCDSRKNNCDLDVRITRRRSKSLSENSVVGNSSEVVPDTTKSESEAGTSGSSLSESGCEEQVKFSSDCCGQENILSPESGPTVLEMSPKSIIHSPPKSRYSSGSDHSYSLRSRGPPESSASRTGRRSSSFSVNSKDLIMSSLIMGASEEPQDVTVVDDIVTDLEGDDDEPTSHCLSAASSLSSLDSKSECGDNLQPSPQKRKRRSRKHFSGCSSAKRKKIIFESSEAVNCSASSLAENIKTPNSSAEKSHSSVSSGLVAAGSSHSARRRILESSPSGSRAKRPLSAKERHRIELSESGRKSCRAYTELLAKLPCVLPPCLREPVLDIKVLGSDVFTCSSSEVRCYSLLSGDLRCRYSVGCNTITTMHVVGSPKFPPLAPTDTSQSGSRRAGDSSFNNNNNEEDKLLPLVTPSEQRSGVNVGRDVTSERGDEPLDRCKFEVVVGCSDGVVALFNGSNGKELCRRCIEGTVRALAVDWGHIFIANERGHVQRWAFKTGGLMIAVEGQLEGLCFMTCLRDGCRKVLLLGGKQQPIVIRDAFSGLLLRSLEVVQSAVYRALVVGGLLYTAGSRLIVTYDFASGNCVSRARTDSDVCSLAACSDLLLAACYDNCIRVYSRQTGALLHAIKTDSSNKLLVCCALYGQNVLLGNKAGDISTVELPQSTNSGARNT